MLTRTSKRVLASIGSLPVLVGLIYIFVPSHSRVGDKVPVDKGGDTLVVLFHGFKLGRESLSGVEERIWEAPEFKDASILRPSLPFGVFSMAEPGLVVGELLRAVQKAWQDRIDANRPYKRIIFVGHSMGGLYARKVYVAACGEKPGAPFEPSLQTAREHAGMPTLGEPFQWAHAIERTVLFAGMNRGWSISHHMSLGRAVLMQTGVILGRILAPLFGRPPIIMTVRRGSPFITNLRLQWLALQNFAGADQDALGRALTVQLLGTIDDLVSPDDNIDLVTGRDFAYMEVPFSGHKNVVQLKTSGEEPTRYIEGRRREFVNALTNSPHILKERSSLRNPGQRIEVNTNANHVIFVIHGIRDEGYWTRRIADKTGELARRQGLSVESVTSSYGYFPMLSFLRPGARQEKVEWLMDQYVEARARYPYARFHYVGHSHGTYLLAKALQDYPALKFENVVFAGSVVHRRYKWEDYIAKRVGKVLNFVATGDWVVAFFPKALQTVGLQDLGSAGHDGFVSAERPGSGVLQPTTNNRPAFVTGGHSTALQEDLWEAMGNFILSGVFTMPNAVKIDTKRQPVISAVGAVAPLLWVVIAFVLSWVGVRLWKLKIREWKRTCLLLAYLWCIWTILTTV